MPGGATAGRTVLVLGGGVGGVVAAQRLRKLLPERDRVVLADREPFHVFQPSLLWVTVGTRKVDRIRRPLERLRRKGIEVVQGEIAAIAAGDKRTSFVGSHFMYEDVSGRGVEEDIHELVQTSDAFYVVKNTPVDAGSVEFSSWTVWIDKDSFLPMKMEYVDEGGEVYRRIEALEVAEFGGHPTVTRMQASDLRSGGATVSEFRNVEYDLGIPEAVFTERTLRSPSRRWFSTR